MSIACDPMRNVTSMIIRLCFQWFMMPALRHTIYERDDTKCAEASRPRHRVGSCVMSVSAYRFELFEHLEHSSSGGFMRFPRRLSTTLDEYEMMH